MRSFWKSTPEKDERSETLNELDGDGSIRSVTTVEKRMEILDSSRIEIVVKALKTKKCKTKDVTREWIEKS